MNYVLFNNDILISDGLNVRRVTKETCPKDVLGLVAPINVCVVDVDVLIAASVENPIEKKDNLLVRKFRELYQHEPYIIQDEKIDNNLFQVIGIKEQKVREVYSLIASEKVETLIPYGVAIRNLLINKKVDLNKTIVFVDDFGKERLLTVFDGLMFSRTRVIANNGEDILPEIKRSQIDFFKKNEEYLTQRSVNFVILINNQSLASVISENEENLPVECLNVPYPALEGLKEINTQIKYRLPEEIIKKRKENEFKKNVVVAILSFGVVVIGFLYFLYNKIEFTLLSNQYNLTRQINEQLAVKLKALDTQTYREELRNHKTLNYAVPYLKILELIPTSYAFDSFKFIKSDRWNLEMALSVYDGGSFDPIPRISILKNVDIKDVYVNNQAGKYLRINL